MLRILTHALCLSSWLKCPSKGERGLCPLNPYCFAFPQCGSVTVFAGKGPPCQDPQLSYPSPAAARGLWESQQVTWVKTPDRWSGEGHWRLVSHVKGFVRAGTTAGKEHLGRDQTCIKTAGASGREAGDNNISGALQACLYKLPRSYFSSSLNVSQFLSMWAGTPSA